MINKITTALLAALVLMQVPSAIQSRNHNVCVSNTVGLIKARRGSQPNAKRTGEAVAFCNGGDHW